MSKCVDDKIAKLIEEGKPRDQAVAIAYEMCGESEKAASFRSYTYNGVTVQATGRRASSRDDKKYERTVKVGDREYLVHYGDPNLPMRRTEDDRQEAFNDRHNCGSKKNPRAPGFWACLDWNRTSEKALDDEYDGDVVYWDEDDAEPDADDEKAVMRPSQAETNYTTLSPVNDRACANCRWFTASGGEHALEGNYCHLIANYPEEVLPTGFCDRHELRPAQTAPDTEDDTAMESEASAPKAKRKRTTEATGIKVAGNHFLITWSNNFEDRDGEIFTAKAIDRYVARVDAGVVPPPEIWIWHAGKATRIGQAEGVGRHEHFVLAWGTFDDTPKGQKARDYYRKHARKTSISHGYLYKSEDFDGKHYHDFNARELSPLPRGAEANRYTALEGVKEMALTDQKRKYIEEVFGEELAKEILTDLEERGKALEEIGVAYKDFVHMDDADKTAPAEVQAVKNVEKDLKSFLTDLVSDNAEVARMAADALKALSAYKAETDAALAEVRAENTKLKEQLDSRPRQASTDAATELTPERIAALGETARNNSKTIDKFWGTEVSEIP